MRKPIYNEKTKRHEINNIPFDGHFSEWKLEYEPETYLKESELSGDEYRKGGWVRIYLNGDRILNEFCRQPERALMLLAKYLHELQCFFEWKGLPFIDDWKTEIVGQKVRHGGIPSTVESYCGDGEVILKRDDGKSYRPDLYPSLADDEDDWKDKDRVHMTDQRINWHITPPNQNIK